MKALLIAPAETAGLEPLAGVIPAPLLPLLGAPLVAPMLRQLAEGGITDVVLVCRSRRSAYKRALLDGRPWNLNLAILELVQADSVSQTLECVRALGFHDDTLAVAPANCWTDVDWAVLQSQHRDAGGGLSRISPGGVETGMLLVDPGVCLSAAPWRTISALFRWRPVNNWAEYWALAKEALEDPRNGVAPCFAQAGPQVRLGPLARIDPEVQVVGPVWLGPGARVDRGAVLRGPIWIGADCRIGPGVTLESCAIEAGAQLHGPLTLRQALVVGNRAIDLSHGEVAVLDDRAFPAVGQNDQAMTIDLLQLATRTSRRDQPAYRTAG